MGPRQLDTSYPPAAHAGARARVSQRDGRYKAMREQGDSTSSSETILKSSSSLHEPSLSYPNQTPPRSSAYCSFSSPCHDRVSLTSSTVPACDFVGAWAGVPDARPTGLPKGRKNCISVNNDHDSGAVEDFWDGQGSAAVGGKLSPANVEGGVPQSVESYFDWWLARVASRVKDVGIQFELPFFSFSIRLFSFSGGN